MKKINTVLFPVAFYENDSDALQRAEKFCRANNAKLTVAHVLFSIFPPYFRESNTVGNIPTAQDQKKNVKTYLENFVNSNVSSAAGIDTVVLTGDPAPSIVEYAENENYDVIMMPVRNSKASGRFMLGSVSYKVLSASKVPVLALPEDSASAEGIGQKVVVALDVYFGIGTIKEMLYKYFDGDKTEVELLIVIDPNEETKEKKREKRILEYEIGKFAKLGFPNVKGKIVIDRHPSDAIVSRAAEGGFDLIVMNTHGRRGISQFILGSTTAEVTHHAKVPVFCVKTDRSLETGDFYHPNLPI